MSGPDPNRQPVWKVLYEAAILEFDPHLVQQRIDETKAAIGAQQKLASNRAENERLKEALDALDTLVHMRRTT